MRHGGGNRSRRRRALFQIPLLRKALHWRSLLVEANPDTFYQHLVELRPDAAKEHGAFCDDSARLEYHDGHYRGTSGQRGEVLSVPHGDDAFPEEADHGGVAMTAVPCLHLADVFRRHGITTHIDLVYVAVEGDALAVIRNMDWTVRVDVWVIELDGYADRNEVVREVLRGNDYVKAEWEIARWCNPYMMGHCMPNEVWLAKGFNPLSNSGINNNHNNNNRRLRAVLEEEEEEELVMHSERRRRRLEARAYKEGYGVPLSQLRRRG